MQEDLTFVFKKLFYCLSYLFYCIASHRQYFSFDMCKMCQITFQWQCCLKELELSLFPCWFFLSVSLPPASGSSPNVCVALIREFIWLKNIFHCVQLLSKSTQTSWLYWQTMHTGVGWKAQKGLWLLSYYGCSVSHLLQGSIWQRCTWEKYRGTECARMRLGKPETNWNLTQDFKDQKKGFCYT